MIQATTAVDAADQGVDRLENGGAHQQLQLGHDSTVSHTVTIHDMTPVSPATMVAVER